MAVFQLTLTNDNMKLTRGMLYYFTALLQGVTLVIIPAASPIFKTVEQNAITDDQYGQLLLPMIATATVATTLLKQIIAVLGKRGVHYLGIIFNIAYMLLTATTYFTKGDTNSSFLLLMVANLMLGAGLGLTVSVLNIVTVEIQPQKSNALLTGLHGCFGIGSAISPLLVSMCKQAGQWQLAPVLAAIAFTVLLIFVYIIDNNNNATPSIKSFSTSQAQDGLPVFAWCFLLVIFLYSLIETSIAYWTSDYLHFERQLSLKRSSEALSIFWAMVTIGRLLASLLTLKLNGWYLYLLSPLLVFISLVLLISAEATSLPLVYVCIGLSCSYFFPLSVSLIGQSFPAWQEKLYSLAVTALIIGIGVGNFGIGYLKDNNDISLSDAFVIAAILALLLLGSVFWLWLKIHKKTEDTELRSNKDK